MISILLCTYNGGRFLSEQLDSLLLQSIRDIKIYIHDDGSNDNTLDIIQSYISKDNRVIFLQDNIIRRGPRYSFMWLLKNVEGEYFMFCDQDDVWLPNKVELMYSMILNKEKILGHKTPILVHTDMKIVDSNLKVLSDSLYRTMRIIPKYVDNFNFMGVCSCGPGCSMLFNKSSKIESLRYDDLNDIPMHDWWIAMNTVKNGTVVYLNTSTMLYRQHSNNTVGVSDVSFSYFVGKLNNIKNTFSKYPEQFIWLRKIGYGGKLKFLFFKILYTIIRNLVKI